MLYQYATIIGFSLSALILGPLLAQAQTSLQRDVVCYHFKGSKLMLRGVCRLTDYDTHSTLRWTDGVVTRINWVSGHSEQPTLDGLPAVTYQRHPSTLKVLNTDATNAISLVCVQAIESNNSVCYQ